MSSISETVGFLAITVTALKASGAATAGLPSHFASTRGAAPIWPATAAMTIAISATADSAVLIRFICLILTDRDKVLNLATTIRILSFHLFP